MSGEYALYIQAADNNSAARRIDLRGAGFYEDLQWSPDSKHLSFRDNSLSLYLIDARSGALQRIAQEPVYTSSAAAYPVRAPVSH